MIMLDFTRLAKDKYAQTAMTTWARDRRINKVNNGFSTCFCVWTNGQSLFHKECKSKKLLKIYPLRRNIEKFFRTAKHSLGLEDCETPKDDQIINNISFIMIALTGLVETKSLKKKKFVEVILGIIKSKNIGKSFTVYVDLVEAYVTF